MGFLGRLFGGGETVMPTHVETLAEFQQATARGPVIVNVWSPTCAPCRKLVPVLEKVATEHAGKVTVVEVNSHAAQPALLASLHVQATPTLIVLDEGDEIGRMTGFRPKSWFDELIAAEFSEAAG